MIMLLGLQTKADLRLLMVAANGIKLIMLLPICQIWCGSLGCRQPDYRANAMESLAKRFRDAEKENRD